MADLPLGVDHVVAHHVAAQGHVGQTVGVNPLRGNRGVIIKENTTNGISNARIEATNNKIKLSVRMAYGFRNIQNMLDMVYLVCSDLRMPLPNRRLKIS